MVWSRAANWVEELAAAERLGLGPGHLSAARLHCLPAAGRGTRWAVGQLREALECLETMHLFWSGYF